METSKPETSASANQRSNTPSVAGLAPQPHSSGRKKAPAPPAPSQTNLKSATPSHTKVTAAKPNENMEVKRPCPEHNFLTDVADVRDMEKGLLLLLEDFHKGKLQVFGRGCTFEQMDQVREKQEKLSRLHFDLDAQQQIQSIDSDDAKDLTFRNLNKLVENLDELNKAVHDLKIETAPPKTPPSRSPKLKTKAKKSEQ